MESGSKIANVSTEPSCELAASSSQNSVPGGSDMEVNTDMKKVLRGGCTCYVPGCYSNTERDKELSFHKFPRDVSLREKWINSIKRKDFISGEQHRVCSQHFHGPKKQGRSDIPTIFPLLAQCKQKSLPKYACHSNLQPKGRIGTGESKVLADAVVEEVDFCVDLSVPMRRKELTRS